MTNLVALGGPDGHLRAHDVLVGRSHQVLAAWLKALPAAWGAEVKVVILDPYAPCRSAIREQLPDAGIVVHNFHGIRLLNAVRRRLLLTAAGTPWPQENNPA